MPQIQELCLYDRFISTMTHILNAERLLQWCDKPWCFLPHKSN